MLPGCTNHRLCMHLDIIWMDYLDMQQKLNPGRYIKAFAWHPKQPVPKISVQGECTLYASACAPFQGSGSLHWLVWLLCNGIKKEDRACMHAWMVTPIQKYNHNACLPSYTALGESSELKMILNYDGRRIGGGERTKRQLICRKITTLL